MATISVSGSVTHRHRAERGVVHLTLGFDGDDRERVVRDGVALHARVAEEATGHRRQGAATWWSAQGVSVGLVTEPVAWEGGGASAGSGDGGRQEPVVRFRSRSTVDVRFQDFDVLAAWVTEVAQRDGVAVDWIEWSLSHDRRPEAERAARVAAVADAVARAGDYAEALGLAMPTLQAVWEPGLRPGGTGSGGFGFARAATMAKGGGDAVFDLSPADIEVTAEISADFTA